MPKEDLSNNIYWQLIGTLMSIKRKLAPILENCHITGLQAYILVMLSSEGGKPMSFLAERLRCDASNITNLVDKLELLGLIERRASSSDRRIKMLFLTAKGNRVCEQIIQDINQLERMSLRGNGNNIDKATVSEALSILQKIA